jgi:mannose-1-phosphate guanylyltransferase
MYAVIMAGGRGTRFWPRSRGAMPKQLLDITGDSTMLQQTVGRIAPLVPLQNILIVTGAEQAALVRVQLPDVPAENIIIEPVGRNTAPCICLAATKIYKHDPDAVMLVLPADHHIGNPDSFRACLKASAEAARETNALITISVAPTQPETGYGYIQYDKSRCVSGAYRVEQFYEKPDRERAVQYLAQGNFLWNSGMFIWKTSVILDAVHKHLPAMHDLLFPLKDMWGTPAIDAAIAEAYGKVQPISIDYGVMEKADEVYTLPGDFGWNDIGSWSAIYDISPQDSAGNALRGDVIAVDSENCMVYSPKKLTAIIGLKDIVVVETDDALLVVPLDRSQDVRWIVDELEKQDRKELL